MPQPYNLPMRHILGFLAGYLISLVTSILLFRVSGHDPGRPASASFMFFTAIYGIAFAFLGGWVAARIGNFSTGCAVAIMIALLSIFSFVTDIGASHWAQAVSIFLMAPAAVAGAWKRRSLQHSAA
jgi:hypothetical protein